MMTSRSACRAILILAACLVLPPPLATAFVQEEEQPKKVAADTELVRAAELLDRARQELADAQQAVAAVPCADEVWRRADENV